MKKITLFVAIAALFAASCSNSLEGSKETQALAPSAALTDSTSYLVGVNFAGFLQNYDFGKLNFSEMEKGINDALNAKGTPRDAEFAKQFKISPELMNDVLGKFLEKRKAYVSALNTEKEKAFFENIANTPNVQKTEEGLYYVVNSAGEGANIALNDTLYVHYTGKLMDGTTFDSTEADGPSANFVLSNVIKGWQIGLTNVAAGADVTLYIPSNLAYGENGQPRAGIGPNAPLVFDVKIDSVKFAK